MMNTFIALFRGINVGGNNLLPMKGLVAILQDMGCEKITTYILSGNVIFQIKKAERHRIAKDLSRNVFAHYGFEPEIILLEAADLLKAVENNPFSTREGKALHFFFLNEQPKAPDLERLAALKSASEKFKLDKNIFYLYAPDGIGRSKLAAQVEQCLKVPATARNWNTVSKLVEMSEQA